MMGRFLLNRFFQAMIVLVGASGIAFFILRVIPGDPATLMLPENATEEEVNQMRESMGLNLPLWTQYIVYFKQMLVLDFGDSLNRGLPSMQLIVDHLPATAILVFWAMVIAIVIAIPLGMLAAVKKNSLSDYAVSILAMLGQSVPSYWLGMMLILLVAVRWDLLPTSGFGSWSHLVLPAFTLAVYQLALIARLMRSSMLDVMHNDYVRTARAKGLPERIVLFKHVFKNALIPTITMIGLQTGQLLGGAIITEYIFSWPGLGFLTVQSIQFRDYPMIQSLVIISALVFVIINLIVDILYAVIDRRIVVDS
ncbi:ABC transporter permease [Bacillus canaveralius]|uniref:ABC transporter permease n=2 Tax=Bacillaceae TaxID=186817 RepID=A0A2N5GL51_9BACI|nr:ABC transporter permease [Bacillus canaveralius]PLR81245.1 ABC transporter permease [Bacillus sp. V33-4]PLR82287.1 ABC transporter permease [Bacillus canaveralius]PLR99476.1 ABC transporter permease [Bacillus canaveralius]RSK49087.1 ABC transporter permease [Bacillus canaveralius]